MAGRVFNTEQIEMINKKFEKLVCHFGLKGYEIPGSSNRYRYDDIIEYLEYGFERQKKHTQAFKFNEPVKHDYILNMIYNIYNMLECNHEPTDISHIKSVIIGILKGGLKNLKGMQVYVDMVDGSKKKVVLKQCH